MYKKYTLIILILVAFRFSKKKSWMIKKVDESKICVLKYKIISYHSIASKTTIDYKNIRTYITDI